MSKPITTKDNGICFAFPNVCWTPAPIVERVPIPYPSIGQLDDAKDTTEKVEVGGKPVVTSDSSIESTKGDQAGTKKGVVSQEVSGKVEFVSYSTTVMAEGAYVVRMGDQTKQNKGNAVGTVLGGNPQVLVGG
jgi:hypothetical protein